MNNFYIEIGKKIKEKRKNKGWSREKLATLSYISDKFLYDIEVGKKGMSAETLYKISKALDISADWLLDG